MGVKQWSEYPKKKPKKSGKYLCSIYIEHGDGRAQSYVMDLWYDVKTNRWLDNRRINVFDTHEVYGHDKGPNGEEVLVRMYKDRLCIRNDVVAFKFLPRPYK